jgi:membrane-associated protease RseP (regulator of RpoE activity)
MHSSNQQADGAEDAVRDLGLELDEFVVDGEDLENEEPQRRRSRPRWLVPLILLVATLVSMSWAGIAAWHILANWYPGMLFAVSLTVILGAHELGHYFATRIYRIQSSLPIFIPFPISPTGTCGAVILMDGMRADKRQIFDIGIAGPLAGLVFAIPIAAIGLMYGEPPQTRGRSIQFGQPVVIQALAQLLPIRIDVKPEPSSGDSTASRPRRSLESEKPTAHTQVIYGKSISNEAMNPMLMAAWVGFLVTGLNMVPISQLDGGHVIFGLLGRRSGLVCWLAYLACVGYVTYTSVRFGQPEYILMLVLIPLMGISHPPSRDDRVSLGLPRQIIGFASLAIPFLCIPMRPIIIL